MMVNSDICQMTVFYFSNYEMENLLYWVDIFNEFDNNVEILVEKINHFWMMYGDIEIISLVDRSKSQSFQVISENEERRSKKTKTLGWLWFGWEIFPRYKTNFRIAWYPSIHVRFKIRRIFYIIWNWVFG